MIGSFTAGGRRRRLLLLLLLTPLAIYVGPRAAVMPFNSDAVPTQPY